MDIEQYRELETEFSVRFPDWYLDLVTRDGAVLDTASVEQSVDGLRTSNQGCREEDPWGFEWTDRFWAFGGDGSGGIYFLDTDQADPLIYYIDHENPPESISDAARIKIMTATDFQRMLEEDEAALLRQAAEMRERVRSRKWWQFWIPRRVPPWADRV